MVKFLLFLFLLLPLYSQEYIISYSSSVKNSILINEKISISKAMTECHGIKGEELIIPHKKNDSLKRSIQNSRENFDTFIQKLPFSIRSYETVSIHSINSLLILKLSPTCFTVKFNEGFVTIAPIKKGSKE